MKNQCPLALNTRNQNVFISSSYPILPKGKNFIASHKQQYNLVYIAVCRMHKNV